MATYRIKVIAETSGAFLQPIEISGFTFRPLAADSGIITIEKAIESERWDQALGRFKREMSPVLDAIATHQLSAIASYGMSTTIAREDQHLATAIFLEQLSGLGLLPDRPVDIAEIESLARNGGISLWYFRHASQALTLETQTLYLLQAAEAAAGQSKEVDLQETNMTSLRQVVGDSCYEYFYSYDDEGKSIRNMLAHGDTVGHKSLSTQSALLVFMIKKHYQQKYSLERMADYQNFRSALQSQAIPPLLIQYADNLPDPLTLMQLYELGQLSASSEPKLLEVDMAEKALAQF
jgi:hypothetical protein